LDIENVECFIDDFKNRVLYLFLPHFLQDVAVAIHRVQHTHLKVFCRFLFLKLEVSPKDFCSSGLNEFTTSILRSKQLNFSKKWSSLVYSNRFFVFKSEKVKGSTWYVDFNDLMVESESLFVVCECYYVLHINNE